MKAIGFIGPSGSGKTTLIERLIVTLTARGLRVATLKHAHHGFDIDRPGKDSYRFRQAGAAQVLIAAPDRWALMTELRDGPARLEDLLARLDPCDLVLVEGFRGDPAIEQIEVRAAAAVAGQGGAANRVALVCDDPAQGDERALPRFGRDDVDAIATFIVRKLALAA